MSRLRRLELDELEPGLREMTRADERTPLERSLTPILGHAPDLARGMLAFGGALKTRGALPRRLVELVRLRIAFHNQCRSCMAIRYDDAVAEGLDEGLVCTLERPWDAPELSDVERLAIRFGELMATDHLAIDDDLYDALGEHLSEAEIVELGLFCAMCVGVGRLAATWHMVEELPDAYRADGQVAPWDAPGVVVT